jgi:hypothetical protein
MSNFVPPELQREQLVVAGADTGVWVLAKPKVSPNKDLSTEGQDWGHWLCIQILLEQDERAMWMANVICIIKWMYLSHIPIPFM